MKAGLGLARIEKPYSYHDSGLFTDLSPLEQSCVVALWTCCGLRRRGDFSTLLGPVIWIPS